MHATATRLGLGATLCFALGSAYAIPITVQVDYDAATLTDVTCEGPAEVCAAALEDVEELPPQVPYWATFVIEDSDRAADGNYDVSGSLAGTLPDALQVRHPKLH